MSVLRAASKSVHPYIADMSHCARQKVVTFQLSVAHGVPVVPQRIADTARQVRHAEGVRNLALDLQLTKGGPICQLLERLHPLGLRTERRARGPSLLQVGGLLKIAYRAKYAETLPCDRATATSGPVLYEARAVPRLPVRIPMGYV
jgi:hypothetical protein